MSGLELYILLLSGYIRGFYNKIVNLQTTKDKVNALLFRVIDYRILILMSRIYAFFPGKHHGLNNSFRQTHFNVLGFQCRTTHCGAVLQQRILKNALLYENKQLLCQLERCASDMRGYINEYEIPSQVIFAPLHTVSDIIQTAIAALVSKKPLVVVSVYNEMKMSKKNNPHGLYIEQFNPESMEGNAGSKFHDIILSLVDGDINMVIFPDAVPECTTKIANKKMKTYPVTLFERHSELHTGLSVVSRLLKQKVLFYTLSMDKQCNLKVNILDCIEHLEVKERTPRLLEEGIRKYSHEWMLWHYTSFYGYNN